MLKFIIKGILRDRHRSLFPFIIISVGVALATVFFTYISGFSEDITKTNAIYDTGHVKIMTRAYEDISEQIPNDLAITQSDSMEDALEKKYPDLDWAPRIKFAGLLDIPDKEGETRAQTSINGIAMELLDDKSKEISRFNLDEALQKNHLPQKPGEILIPCSIADDLELEIGETATLISSTATGGMAVHNFTIAGTIEFGVGFLDRNTVIADIDDIRYALNMPNSTGELLGYFENGVYKGKKARQIKQKFNQDNSEPEDKYSPLMLTLEDQNGLGEMLKITQMESYVIIGIFLFVMSLVLWNSGLMSGIRRYGEIGVRIAIGESKLRVYREMLVESFIIGFLGSIFGTIIGLAGGYYLQEVGIDISGMMPNSSVLISSVIRAKVTTTAYYIGFIPGLLATFIGKAMAGIGILKRETSQLFRELET